MATPLLLILCTVPERQTALDLARRLVAEGLAACVNITPSVTSVYRWEDKLEVEDELLVLIKATQAGYPRLEARLRSLHPYELPEIIAVPVEQGLHEYIDWVEQCTITKS